MPGTSVQWCPVSGVGVAQAGKKAYGMMTRRGALPPEELEHMAYEIPFASRGGHSRQHGRTMLGASPSGRHRMAMTKPTNVGYLRRDDL